MTLIGYWPLNETEEDTAYDYSGNEKHGSLNGGITQGAVGILGNNAYNFDGSDDHISRNIDLSSVTSSTIAMWWKPSIDIVNGSEHVGLWGYSQDNDNNIRWGWYGSRDLWELRVESGSNSAASINHTKHFSSGEWVFDIIVLRESSAPEWYINGTHETTGSGSGSFSTIGGTYDFIIGLDYQTSSPSSDFWNGHIQEVRLYDRALTPQEIQYLYTAAQRGRQVTNKKSI